MKRLLVDGDECAYYSSLFGQQKLYIAKDGDKELFSGPRKREIIESIQNHDWEIEERVEDLGEAAAVDKCREWMGEVVSETGVTNFTAMFNGDRNFRYELATILPYKGNREGARPIHLKACIDYMKSEYPFHEVPYLESDDLLGINQGLETIIVTSDKDLNMVPGWHYNPRRKEMFELGEEYCTHFHYLQMLMGDATDNIPGLSYVGESTANKMLGNLTKEKDLYDVVIKAYRDNVKDGKHYIPKGKRKGEVAWESDKSIEDIVYEIANLLFMRREIGEDAYWRPPK